MENIYKKLEEIRVLDPEFKQLIFDKLILLTPEKIEEIDRLLSEILSWENDIKKQAIDSTIRLDDEMNQKDKEKIEEIKKIIANL